MPSTCIDLKDFVKQKQKKVPILSKNYDYLTPKEYALHVQKHYITIYRMLKQGTIEGATKVGNTWRIPVLRT